MSEDEVRAIVGTALHKFSFALLLRAEYLLMSPLAARQLMTELLLEEGIAAMSASNASAAGLSEADFKKYELDMRDAVTEATTAVTNRMLAEHGKKCGPQDGYGVYEIKHDPGMN